MLTRPAKETAKVAWKMAADTKLPAASRVAAMYTYAQAAGADGIANLVKLSTEPAMREYALRALADRKPLLAQVPIEPFMQGLSDPSVRVQTAAIIGLGRLERPEAIPALLQVKVPASFVAPTPGTEGPHATPNSAIIPAHLAMRALVALNAVDACVQAIGTQNNTLALWALRYMHDPKAVNGLMAAYKKTNDASLKNQLLTTLSRLYKKEADYDGSWWWSTRPDTHGPYYKAIAWESSPGIRDFLVGEWSKASDKKFFTDLNSRHRMEIAEFGTDSVVVAKEEPKVTWKKSGIKRGRWVKHPLKM